MKEDILNSKYSLDLKTMNFTVEQVNGKIKTILNDIITYTIEF